jgi:hypothetical protein
MKDAKGHGSNPRGTLAAHQARIPKLADDEWAQILAETKTRIKQSEQYLADVLKTKQAIFEKGDRKLVISKSLDANYDLRATDFDAQGPSGHREYKLSETRGLKDEISQALAGGYKLRPRK